MVGWMVQVISKGYEVKQCSDFGRAEPYQRILSPTTLSFIHLRALTRVHKTMSNSINLFYTIRLLYDTFPLVKTGKYNYLQMFWLTLQSVMIEIIIVFLKDIIKDLFLS